jgi:hypothetical protein
METNLSTLLSEKIRNSSDLSEGEYQFSAECEGNFKFNGDGNGVKSLNSNSLPPGEFSIDSRSSNVRRFSKSE